MAEKPQRVLIVGPAWVGDMIMSQVIYSVLRAKHADIEIDVLAPQATVTLVRRMAEVNRGILLKQQHGELGLSYRMNLGRQLATEGYDQAIVTPNSFKSALVPFFASIPRRTGFLGEYRYFLLNDIHLLDKRRLPLMTDRLLDLVDTPGTELTRPSLMVDPDNQTAWLEREALEIEGGVVGFCPGAEFGEAKRWPEQHFIALGRSLVARGQRVWVFGGPADASIGERIAAAIGEGAVNLAGKTTLLDAIDLLALCSSVVTNDSGLMHVAAGVGVRVLALYGSTSPGFTPPLSDQASTISLELACSPCFKRECPLGHKNCLNQLAPERVLEHL